jgi:hypothetical protein
VDLNPVNGFRLSGHRDFVLWCEGCRHPTKHTFAERVPVGIRTIEIMYECVRCNTRRVYGREEGSIGELYEAKTKAVKP